MGPLWIPLGAFWDTQGQKAVFFGQKCVQKGPILLSLFFAQQSSWPFCTELKQSLFCYILSLLVNGFTVASSKGQSYH